MLNQKSALFVLLIGVSAPVSAQVSSDPQQHRLDALGNRPVKQKRIQSQTEFHKVLELPKREPALPCEAKVHIDYHQADTEIRVQSTVTTAHCPSANGHYVLRLRSIDAEGQAQTRELTEQWQTDGAGGATLERSYNLLGDVEVRWLSLRRASCTCPQPEESAPMPAASPD